MTPLRRGGDRMASKSASTGLSADSNYTSVREHTHSSHRIVGANARKVFIRAGILFSLGVGYTVGYTVGAEDQDRPK